MKAKLLIFLKHVTEVMTVLELDVCNHHRRMVHCYTVCKGLKSKLNNEMCVFISSVDGY